MEIVKYSQDSLAIVKSSDFLIKDDWDAVSGMKDELQDTFEKKQLWRTETEMRVSVLNELKFPTKASKYWQCVREQSVFFENLVCLSFEYRRNLVKIARIENELSKFFINKFRKQELIIDLEECNFAKKNMEVQAKDRVREIKLWSKIKKEVNDGSFDDKNVNSHQAVSYAKEFINDLTNSGGTGSPSERINLIGKAQTALHYCEDNQLLDEVFEGMNPELVAEIKKTQMIEEDI